MKSCIGVASGRVEMIEPCVRRRIAESPARLLMGGVLCLICCLSFSGAAACQQISAPEPQTGTIIGTVIDVNGGVVPGATVLLQGPPPDDDPHAVANDDGFFHFEHVKPGIPYHLTVSASGFADWTSPEVNLSPGQYFELTGIQLSVVAVVTTVRAVVSNEEIATEQVKAEEKQRVLGFIPNFYVVYDRGVVSLTPGLKFNLALKASTDPVTFLGAASLAGIDQAAKLHDYQQGAKGYGKRLGAAYSNFFTEMMIGDAILPSILHQDPRYFYQGTGTTKSRMFHALSNPFVCRGDNGHLQPNYSAWGGYLASGAISNAYYPASNRGPGLVLSTALIDLAQSMANGVLQEFVLRKLTPAVRSRPY
ncbi:MAG: carboxypeptidase-like regulatory domain-containing protein [Silvibacterium sp.]